MGTLRLLVSLLPTAILFLNGFQLAEACELAAGNSSDSCLNLRATPYITSAISGFGPFIEGASVNPSGQIFAVNYGAPSNMNQLGQVYPRQKLLYSDELRNSLLNGIRFINSTRAFVADATNHRVLKLTLEVNGNDTVVTSSGVYCSSQEFIQPNDLTLAISTGTVVTSGMSWVADTNNTHGDIWSCLANGQVKKLEVMGRTNGIDLSPDERTLYVSESHNRGGTPYVQKVWRYSFNPEEGTISNKTLFIDFGALDGSVTNDVDGMKTDVLGNLYVTRHGGSQVAIFSPSGELIGRIALNFSNPTNLEFGGPNGTTLFIVGKCIDNDNKGCVDHIEMANRGRTWHLLQG